MARKTVLILDNSIRRRHDAWQGVMATMCVVHGEIQIDTKVTQPSEKCILESNN